MRPSCHSPLGRLFGTPGLFEKQINEISLNGFLIAVLVISFHQTFLVKQKNANAPRLAIQFHQHPKLHAKFQFAIRHFLNVI
jgi:hypothetical protein